MKQQIKQNNIKHIPTELNFYHIINNKLKKHREVINISRIMILLLIVWNLLITTALIIPAIKSPIPQFTDSENKTISQLEEIPKEDLLYYVESLQD